MTAPADRSADLAQTAAAQARQALDGILQAVTFTAHAAFEAALATGQNPVEVITASLELLRETVAEGLDEAVTRTTMLAWSSAEPEASGEPR